jgi:hypothetical protein
VKLEFRPDDHTYYIEERQVPSVSSVLEPLNQLDGIPPSTLERARLLGQHAHKAIALMLYKALEWRKLDPVLVPYCMAAQKFVKEADVRVLSIEHRMGDPGLKFAGTLDLLGIMGKYTCVYDWKCVDTMPRTAGPQTAAYDYLYRRNTGSRPLKRYGVQLFSDGTYKLFPFEDPRDWNFFQSALNIWHWRNSK